jgi:hypothetical protein
LRQTLKKVYSTYRWHWVGRKYGQVKVDGDGEEPYLFDSFVLVFTEYNTKN